ncbi:D-alanyl-D-alanine carboxypeptidase [Streptomyces sp. NPDC002057]|uniref:D-alanyl-D-alanine carboxypeptidase family protein n=1 Tax=Streptomyces sp. NPDC002057 TaxID=3154664 RepID=UPI0033269EA4
MAGESPDRAEQQGPSQETTASGGGGRDPRLSVFHESDASSSAAVASSGSTPASSASSATSTSASGSASTSASSVQVDQPTAVFKNLAPRTPEDDAPAATPEPESERLKAAVAAWVATAEEPEAESEGESEGAASTAAEGSGSATGAEVEDGAEAGESGADEPEPDAESLTEPEPASASASASDAESDTADEDDPEDDPEDGDGDEPEDAEPEDEAEADADDDADEEPVQATASAEAKAPAESWFASRKPAEAPKREEPSSDDSATEGATDTTADAPDASDDASDDVPVYVQANGPDDGPDDGSGDVDEEPVDQPTTMFKAVRPPAAPPVDQPTTALKLPPSLREGSDSERTSTFLPLRADIPAEQKAQEAASKAPGAPKAPQTPGAPKPAASAASAAAPAAKPAPAPVPSPALAEPERTRQQPLPPLPPLDLLAELTNTPPPAPTPLRTTMRRVRIWTPLVLLVLIVFAIVQMVRPLPAPVLTLSAAPTFSFEGGELKMPWPTEGQGAVEVEGVGSMGTYGAQKPAPIASVTKTMTAYVILRDHPLKGNQKGPEIEIDKKAADQGKAEHESTAAVQEGQTYTEKELLQLLMIPSANNVARLLARWDAGSEAAFVEKMNAAAKDLGMSQSTYTDPSGLLDSTVSTPQDQLKLAKAVMQYDVFREIVNMPNVTVDGIPGRIENNNNILLKPGVSGIKTGSSTPAGGNLLWSANTVVDGKNRRILGIVMGAKDAKQLGEKLQLSIDYSYELIKKAQKDVTSAAVVRKGQILGYVDDGLGGRTPVVATKELRAVGWPGLQVKLELTDGGKALAHTGKAGDVVGQVSIGTGVGKVSSPVALQADLVEPGFDKKLTRVG